MQAEVIYLSSWQHPNNQAIDFAKVKAAGYHGVLIKSSQGTNYVNNWFKPDAEGALAEGLLVGAVPYAQPNGNDAYAEADLHIKTIAGYDLALGQWLDWDDPEPLYGIEATQWIAAWYEAVNGRCDVTGVYIDNNQLGRGVQIPGSAKLWAADTLTNPPKTPYIQFQREIMVPGIASLVDVQVIPNVRGINTVGTAPIAYTGKVYNMNEVRQGDSGQQVKVLQHYLNGLGYTLTVDGEFGPLTDGAVRELQTGHQVTVDGIVGPITWGILIP